MPDSNTTHADTTKAPPEDEGSAGEMAQQSLHALREPHRVPVGKSGEQDIATLPRPPGRPRGSKIKAKDQRKPRSIRLNDSRWGKLQRLGSAWLEGAIDRAKEPATPETLTDSKFEKAGL